METYGVYAVFYAVMLGGVVLAIIYGVTWGGLVFVGMLGLSAYHSSRHSETVKAIGDQLRMRQVFPVEAWGSHERAGAAELAGRIIAEEIDWPNGNLLPEDPLEILFYCPWGDGGEGLAIGHQLATVFGPRPDWRGVATFGEFVDLTWRNRRMPSRRA